VRERADRLHHQLGQRLLDHGADDLQHRHFGSRRAPAAQLVDETQIRDLEGEKLDFAARADEFAPEPAAG